MLGPLLNLAAKAFLFGADPEAFEVEIAINTQLRREQAELEAWRRFGPIGKLHNIVIFVRRSSQRREHFLSLSEIDSEDADFMLVQDNVTRWNSTYLMIDRALKKQSEIDIFCDRWAAQTDENRRLPREDRLTPEDWRILTEMHAILKPFYHQT
jgi:hypothetical protein